jgi:hypothetical protein
MSEVQRLSVTARLIPPDSPVNIRKKWANPEQIATKRFFCVSLYYRIWRTHGCRKE